MDKYCYRLIYVDICVYSVDILGILDIGYMYILI